MTADTAHAPYVGLRPFRETDHRVFFGRERDVRIISSNLRAQPLTVLYGPSGVGKSSVLHAGVVPYLKAGGDHAVLYCNEWQGANVVEELTARCHRALAAGSAAARLDETLEATERRVFLLLDQFEEYLLYHGESEDEEFDSILARIVNREDVAARVLIGIREDALSRLDQRFGIRIPNLLGNTLSVEHLGPAAARDAIRKPLEVLNAMLGQTGIRYRIQDELVEEILRQVQWGQLAVSDSTGAGVAAARAASRIETAFLQLVLTRLWEEEQRAGSQVLRLETLARIGGAATIVQRHVERVMRQFESNQERDAAAGMFRYLVTPSRTKVAQSTEDLISFAEAPEPIVRGVLSALADRPESRILRRLANPERYEIFHDVLAQPILDWRRDYLQVKERAAEQERLRLEAEQKQRELEQAQALAKAQQERAEEQARSARRLRWMLAGVAAALLLAFVAAIYAFVQRQQAREHARSEALARAQADLAKSEAMAAWQEVESRRAEAEAARAEAAGKTAEAERLRREADLLAKEANQAKAEASVRREQLATAAEGKDPKYRNALQQADDLRRQLAAAIAERDRLKKLLDAQAGPGAAKSGQVRPGDVPLRGPAGEFATADGMVRGQYHCAFLQCALVMHSPVSVAINVDVNHNGAVDGYKDVAFGLTAAKERCPQYFIRENTWTGCGGFKSASTAEFVKDGNLNVVTWTIPLGELTTVRDSVWFQIQTWDETAKVRRDYPAPPFRSVYRIDLAGAW